MFKKIVSVILKIIRWPALYILPIIFAVYILFFLTYSTNDTGYLKETLGKYSVLIVLLALVFAYIEGIISSTFFTDTFLASTGIAAAVYLLISFTLNAENYNSDYVAFDMMKMMAVIALVLFVLLGDLTVLITRKIKARVKRKTASVNSSGAVK